MAYDIFISYKRKSLATANNLYYRLTTRGYSTFFDLEEMGRDNFNVQLLNYIENAKDVFVILEEGSLDACKQDNWENDWFCKEIAHALKTRKNIIPILIGDYKMPEKEFLPKELQELSLKNAPEFSFSFFEEYLDKLIEKGYITAEAQIKNQTTSVFKFYSNENCQVFKDGKLVCSLDGMADKPYYLPVSRKGDYNFKCVNSVTNEPQMLKEHIDADEEKNVDVVWPHRKKRRNWFGGNKKGCGITISVSLMIVVVLISGLWLIDAFNAPQNTPHHCSSLPVKASDVCLPVDLGLTSQTLWGDRNVGAESPSGFGELYSWGETEKKEDYSEYTYVEELKPFKKITDSCHDVAMSELGNGWTMPTEEQFKELLSECDWRWANKDGHNGYIVTGSNGNSIFLPASGWSRDTTIEYRNKYGYYWTSERSSNSRFARSLQFPKDGKGVVGNGYIYVGRSIRAVYENK